MLQKKPWKQPLIKSIDNLGLVLGGTCTNGQTVTPTSPDQCATGKGAGTGNCQAGKGAAMTCSAGKGGN
jgi:hypothetical protein